LTLRDPCLSNISSFRLPDKVRVVSHELTLNLLASVPSSHSPQHIHSYRTRYCQGTVQNLGFGIYHFLLARTLQGSAHSTGRLVPVYSSLTQIKLFISGLLRDAQKASRIFTTAPSCDSMQEARGAPGARRRSGRGPTMHTAVHMCEQFNAQHSSPPNASQGVLSRSPAPSRGPP
jgi:hypothetical protein